MHLVCYQPQKWFKLRGEALKQTKKEPNCKIIASDIDEEAVEKARRNAVVAGVSEYITFEVCDFAATTMPEKADDARGVIIMNPPYGERLGDSPHLLGLYSEMGVFIKENQPAYDGYILSGNASLVDAAGIIADEAITFYNGGIPCEFMRNPEPTAATIAKVRAQRRRYGRE
jgi:putative N6-adenine-specific DNA methylase